MVASTMERHLRALPTQRQLEVWIYIKDRVQMTGVSPTTREIAKHFEVTSNAIARILNALQKKKLITRKHGCARTVRPVEMKSFLFLGSIN